MADFYNEYHHDMAKKLEKLRTDDLVKIAREMGLTDVDRDKVISSVLRSPDITPIPTQAEDFLEDIRDIFVFGPMKENPDRFFSYVSGIISDEVPEKNRQVWTEALQKIQNRKGSAWRTRG